MAPDWIHAARRQWIWFFLLVVGIGLSTGAVWLVFSREIEQPLSPHQKQSPDELDVAYVSTPQPVVEKMLQMAKVTKDDVVYDLGCGDGRIVVTAAKVYGCRAVGVDLDPERVKESKENAEKNHVEKLVVIERKDIFKVDLSEATVVALYTLPEVNVQLIPQFQQLKPGSRIVSHDFGIKGMKPRETFTMRVQNSIGLYTPHKIYLWVTPLEKE